MSSTSATKVGLPAVLGNEVSIISRREIEPLLAKARQTLAFYTEATNCPSVVLDRTGNFINIPEYKDQQRFCIFCRNHWHSLTPGFGGIRIWNQNECPCARMHDKAYDNSRRIGKTYIFSCVVGFIYWTSPLYRNGRYAGALLAGQVLSCKREEAAEKFRAVCRDRIAAEKFAAMLKDVPEKTHSEIRAMAKLLGICAEEISVKGENLGNVINRKTWQEQDYEDEPEPVETRQKNKASASGRSTVDKHHGSTENPTEKELKLFAAFRRGDNETGSKILTELLGSTMAAVPGDYEAVRYRAIELVVLLSRAAAGGAADSDSILEINNRYLRRIQEAVSIEELLEILRLAAEQLAGNIFSYQGIRHAAVLRKAGRFIWDNYTRKLSLEEIARNSGLSAPYFSTTFKEEMGENLSTYLNRLRVEKATVLLTETGKTLSEIAGLCGFEDQSWFSKIFKKFVGMSPGKFREHGVRLPLRTGKQTIPLKDVNLPESAFQNRRAAEHS